ncbi:hypothetical protein OG432_00485 [Streptomyces sp. NBC_00442]|uniref:hypothetical protein n=1 Tax=Streptomyces sp. NBC_00442 TaxID=2903651 RepID=UPI002E1DA64D
MNCSVSASVPACPPLPTSPKDRTRLWAAAAALLFVPTAVVTGIVTLFSDRASGCLTQGVQCTPGLPSWAFEWSVGTGALALLVALAAPAVRVRRGALAAQLFAEAGALLAILSHA